MRAEAADTKPESADDAEVIEEPESSETGWTGMKEEAIDLDGEFVCMDEARIRVLKGHLSRELAMLESIPSGEFQSNCKLWSKMDIENDVGEG